MGLFSSDCSDITENKKGHIVESPEISQAQHIFLTWVALPNANENVNRLAVTVGRLHKQASACNKTKILQITFQTSDCLRLFPRLSDTPQKLSNQIPIQLLPKKSCLTHRGSIKTQLHCCLCTPGVYSDCIHQLLNSKSRYFLQDWNTR